MLFAKLRQHGNNQRPAAQFHPQVFEEVGVREFGKVNHLEPPTVWRILCHTHYAVHSIQSQEKPQEKERRGRTEVRPCTSCRKYISWEWDMVLSGQSRLGRGRSMMIWGSSSSSGWSSCSMAGRVRRSRLQV